jgi:hypothetical protein
MKKIFFIFVAVFLIAGTAAFAQNESTLMMALGFQMNFTKHEEFDWSNSPAITLGTRVQWPLTESLYLGLAAFFNGSFIKEMYWTSPSGLTYKITGTNVDFDTSWLLAASLWGPIAGPFSFVLDLGPALIWKSTSFTTTTTTYDTYSIHELGLGMNGGIQFDISMITLEAGANMGLSFFKRDSYKNGTNDQKSGTSRSAAIFRVNPYMLVGMRMF